MAMRKPDAIQLFKALPCYDLEELARGSAPLAVALRMLRWALPVTELDKLPSFLTEELELALTGYAASLQIAGEPWDNWRLRLACEYMLAQLFPCPQAGEPELQNYFVAQRVAALVLIHCVDLVKRSRPQELPF